MSPNTPGWLVRVVMSLACAASLALVAKASADEKPIIGPHPFTLLRGTTMTYGIMAKNTSPITVTVTAKGTLPSVAMTGPGGKAVAPSKQSAASISFEVPAAGVPNNSVWKVIISDASKSTIDLKTEAATGMIDMNYAVGQLPAAPKAAASDEMAAKAKAAANAMPKGAAPELAARKAVIAKAASDRHEMMKKAAIRRYPALRTPYRLSGSTPPPATPSVTGTDQSAGDPGTPVVVTGTGFGQTQGEVHFIVAQGRDIVAPVDYWSPTQVMCYVPFVTGVQAFAGQMYVMAGSQKSNLVPFQFSPTMDVQVYAPPKGGAGVTYDNGSHEDGATYSTDPYGDPVFVVWHESGFWSACTAFDYFYPGAVLKNGWGFDQVVLAIEYPSKSVTSKIYSQPDPGASSAAFTIRSWADTQYNTVKYTAKLLVTGPAGTSYQ